MHIRVRSISFKRDPIKQSPDLSRKFLPRDSEGLAVLQSLFVVVVVIRPLLSWSHQVVVPPCGGGGRREEGWSHRVEEEEGGGKRGGPSVWRKREGRLFSICEITTCLIRGSMERRRFNICEITTCSEFPPLDFKSSVVYLMCSTLDY